MGLECGQQFLQRVGGPFDRRSRIVEFMGQAGREFTQGRHLLLLLDDGGKAQHPFGSRPQNFGADAGAMGKDAQKVWLVKDHQPARHDRLHRGECGRSLQQKSLAAHDAARGRAQYHLLALYRTRDLQLTRQHHIKIAGGIPFFGKVVTLRHLPDGAVIDQPLHFIIGGINKER